MNISLSWPLLVLLLVFVINENIKTNGLRRVRHKSREHCQLIPDSGSCTATLRRWYYDSESGECKTFIWGGCDGNDNRFRSRRQCERRCKGRGSTSDDDRMSTYFRAVSRSGRGCPRLRCGEQGSSCPAGTSPVFSTDDAGCPICTCRQLTAFLRPSITCPPLDCSHLVCVGPVRFSSRLVGHCPVCECVPVDDQATESTRITVMSSSCPDLDCSDHIRCHGGRKLDPQTGCQTCECVDECADCAAICASLEPTRCREMCSCDVISQHSCRPLPIDCEFRDGCVLGMDDDGCEVCRCAVEDMPTTLDSATPACPQITCPPTCEETEYTVDVNGCRACACVSNEMETTPTTMTMTTSSEMIGVTNTSCVGVDCVSQCPEKFDIVKSADGCNVCVCSKSETVTDDVTEPTCVCSSDDCANCNKSSADTERQNDVDDDMAVVKCEPLMRDDCDVSCVVATDDAGCQFCLCDDKEKHQETEITDDWTVTTGVKMTTAVVDDATTTNVDDACEQQFICHPICHAVLDARGCVVECRCDDVLNGLPDMQQQEQEVAADFESRVTCTTSDSACLCDASSGEEELWTIDEDGCLTCICVTPSITTTTSDDISHVRMEDITSTTSTIVDAPSTTTDTAYTTTTQMMTQSTTSVTVTSTSRQDVTSSTATIATSSELKVKCRQLSDGDCTGVTCGKDGYAKDENGCDTCSCAITTKDREPIKTVYHVVAAARKGPCSLSPLRGPCRAAITRWYYDVISGTCETFSYGGCRGNANNFRSPGWCQRYCRPVVDEKQHQSRLSYLRVLGLLR